MKYNFHVYVHFSGNAALLNKCLASLLPEARKWSRYAVPIIILNNTKEDLKNWVTVEGGWTEVKPPTPLIWATAHNWLIEQAHDNVEDFAFSCHTDVEIAEGAFEEVFSLYERVKDTKWYCIFANECFGMHNIDFFYNEKVWYDAFLFPMYYSDNHVARIAFLRGYQEQMYASGLVKHSRSHTIQDDPVMGRRNSLGFPKAGEIYRAIWGGMPGSETVADPYANGTLSK